VSLLLDTQVLLLWLGDGTIAPEARSRITDPANLVAVSAASIWEISIKKALGKLRFEGSIVDYVASAGFEPLPVLLAHAEHAGTLPSHHRDPFDRMLIAQAQLERLSIVTRDAAFDAYDVPVLKG